MNRQPLVLALGLVLAGPAGAESPARTVTVTVLPGHYVLASRAYDDLGRLEDAVRALRPKDIALDACGPRETRALAAGQHRFRDLPTRTRSLSITADPACFPPALAPARLGASGGPTGIDDRAVSEYWSGLLP